MNLILHWTSHHYAELMMNFLRCVVLMELFQNAWSLSVVNTGGGDGRGGATLLQKARRSNAGIPWRKNEKDKKDEAHVWLEDDFLAENSNEDGATAPDFDYNFEVSRYLEEDTLSSEFDPIELEIVDDENLAP